MSFRWLYCGWLLLSLAACDRARIAVGPIRPGLLPPGGDEVGNGGEAIQVLFEMGQRHAQMVLESLEARSIQDSGLMTSDKELSDFLDNRADLLNEFRSSKVVWTKNPIMACPPDRCGCTLPKKGNTVYLNFKNCDNRYDHPREAGQVLIHEMGHHLFGEDEIKPTSVAATAYTLWKGLGHPDDQHWMTVSKKGIPSFSSRTQATWTGSELAVWDTNGTVGYFHPRKKIWREEFAPLGFEQWYIEQSEAQSDRGFWIAGKIHVYSPCHAIRRNLGAGQSYDPLHQTWDLMPSHGAPGGTAVAKPYKNNLVVWGGESCGGNTVRARIGGAIWDVTTRLWKAILPPEGMPVEFGYSWVIAKDILFVWGGEKNTKAWLYDLKLGKWESWDFSNETKGREAPMLVSTGNEILAFSADGRAGYRLNPESKTVQGMPPMPPITGFVESLRTEWFGAGVIAQGNETFFYDPFRDVWKVSPDLIRPPARRDQTWHWNGSELIVWGGENRDVGYLFYP